MKFAHSLWWSGICLGVLGLTAFPLGAQDARITVRGNAPVRPISRYLTGACIEDVNHEIYGGLYSQMIFGESFQEPPVIPVPAGFQAFGGQWRVRDGELHFSGNPGDKLINETPAFADGEVGVEICFDRANQPNAGLITRVARPGRGVDEFDGYEIALSASGQNLRLGRHRHNWELIRDTPCKVPVRQWIALSVALRGSVIEARVNGELIIRHDDGPQSLAPGAVGLRAFQNEARYRDFWIKTGAEKQPLKFVSTASEIAAVSGMWRPVQRGTAAGQWQIETQRPFVGQQGQRISFAGGAGEIGVENRGLNRWGMHFVAGKVYEGVVWARADADTELYAALESSDGARNLAERKLKVKAGDWQRLTFTLQPKSDENSGRFTLALRQPGSVVLGHAFLQPGAWGRFKGQPVRRDVAEAMVNQGLTVLRYGGSMINHQAYRWKNMIGPRDRRPPTPGTWYPFSSNGWGILDFLNFCEAAGFLAIPAFSVDESPQDMADFIEYAKGSARSGWGQKRAADGHPKPYDLRFLQLGNEERVDERYYEKFKALAEVIWAKDPNITLVVGDFVYGQIIKDPFRFSGAASGITSLAAQQKILQLAKQHDREVWFDLHVGTDGPRPDGTFAAMFSFLDALEKLADGARFKVAVFEFNAGNHAQRRALANALAIQAIERDGRIPVAASANALQPDGQNDNGWDQGLLFLNPAQVWLQPPGHVTRMIARHYQPQLVPCAIEGGADTLDATAKRSEDGRQLVVQVVNLADRPQTVAIYMDGFTPRARVAQVEELAGPLNARNTAAAPNHIAPRRESWAHGMTGGTTQRQLPPHSFTVIHFK